MTDRKQIKINNNKAMLKSIFDFIDECSNRLAMKEQEEEIAVPQKETEAESFSRYIREKFLGRSWAEITYDAEEEENAAALKQCDMARKAMSETPDYELEEGEIFE